MTQSWPPPLTAIHTPCKTEPSKFPFPTKVIFLFHASICFKVTVYTNMIINYFFFYFRILTHFQVSIAHFISICDYSEMDI